MDDQYYIDKAKEQLGEADSFIVSRDYEYTGRGPNDPNARPVQGAWVSVSVWVPDPEGERDPLEARKRSVEG